MEIVRTSTTPLSIQLIASPASPQSLPDRPHLSWPPPIVTPQENAYNVRILRHTQSSVPRNNKMMRSRKSPQPLDSVHANWGICFYCAGEIAIDSLSRDRESCAPCQ